MILRLDILLIYSVYIQPLLGLSTLHLLFYCLYSYVVGIFEQPLAQEFPSGSYYILSYFIF